MKKQLLIIILCFTTLGWGQISEYVDGNSLAVELGNADNPGFVELNSKFYFVGTNSSTDVIYSVDTNNTLLTEFDTAGLTGANSLESLTVFNGQLYFVASDNGNTVTKKLFRLLGNNAAQLISNDVIVTGFDEMVVWDNELYFSGKLDSTSDNALLKYTGTSITIVNGGTPGVDFDPKRLTVNPNTNALFFFTRVADFGPGEALWRLNIAQKVAGNTTITQVGSLDFIDFFSFAPPITEFANGIYVIGRTENDAEPFLYQAQGASVSRVSNNTGYSPGSFYDIQTNNGGTVYNGKLAIFRSSVPGSFVNDKLTLLSPNNTIEEFDLPNNVNGSQFYSELNGALIFYGTNQNGTSIEYLYEFRENTITDVLPQTRVIHDYLNNQSQRPYYGSIFNNKFYFYGASLNDINKRTLHEYDPTVLNYGPFVDNQEELDFLGSLGYKKILDQVSLQDGTAVKGGAVINTLIPLSDIEEMRYLLIDGVAIQNLVGLGNLTRIYDFLEVFQNAGLISLEGLNPNIIFDSSPPFLNNNPQLSNFCTLQSWAVNNPGFSSTFTTSGNAYNPTFSQLQSSTECQQAVCTALSVDPTFEDFLENGTNTFFDVNGVAIPNADISNGANDGFVCQEGIERIAEIDYSPSTAINFVNIDKFIALKKFALGAIPTSTGSSLDLSENLALEEINIAPNSFTVFDLPKTTGASLQKVFLGNNGSFTWPNNNFTIDLTNSPALTEFRAITTTLPTVDLSNSTELLNVEVASTVIEDLFLFGCNKLQEVNLDGASTITSFGLSNMPDLNSVLLRNSSVQTFLLENTGLSGIFFTEQSALEEINLVGNSQLTTVDFSQNGGVPPSNLARVILSNNNLSSLNVFTLGNIEELDVIQNSALIALDGLADLIKLINLKTYGTGISSLDLSANDGSLTNLEVGQFGISGNLDFLNLKNNNLIYDFIALSADDNPGLCIQVNSVQEAQDAVNNGFWSVDSDPNIFQFNCNPTCTAVTFADANLKSFFLDPANASRILDATGNPVSGLVVNGEICQERAIEVFEVNLDGGYNNAPITSLVGLQEFTNLGRLNIGGAQLTGAINLELFANLEEFEASGNEISSLTASNANGKLTRIDVSFQGANEDVLTAVNFNGSSIPVLESLSLQNNRNLGSVDLTKTPSLTTFRPDNTSIALLDLTQLANLDAFDTFYLKDDENDGALQQIDFRNNLGNFDVANFNLDATGHPNLSCVLVDQGNLSTAQNNVANGTWLFDISSVVKTECASQTVTVRFEKPSDSDLEGSGQNRPRLILEGTLSQATSISIQDLGTGSAISSPNADADYELIASTIQIDAGTYNAANPISLNDWSIIDDTNFEGNETINLIIEVGTSGLQLVNGQETFTYTILEDDYRVQITAQGSIAEAGSNGSFELSLLDGNDSPTSNESGRAISISYLDNGTALQGQDYNLSGSATITPNQQSTTISVIALDDNLYEGDEDIVLIIEDDEGYFVDSAQNAPSDAMQVADNDNFISIVSARNGTEGAEDALFTATLQDNNGIAATNATQNAVAIDIVLSSGTGTNAAIIDNDFVNGIKGSNELTFFIEAGSQTGSFEVVIIDDTILENIENFIVDFSAANATIMLNNNQATGLINDNDDNTDADNDGIPDNLDNCPNTANTDQADLDNDNIGDVCDNDIDGDGVDNAEDDFPEDATETNDNDGDGSGDNADTDDDNDGVSDEQDNCPNSFNITVGSDGCPQEVVLAADDIQVLVTSETCENKNNGGFLVTIANQDYTFNVSLDNVFIGTASALNPLAQQNNLASGNYTLCFTLDAFPDFEQCFGVTIVTFERLAVDTNGIDAIGLKASFSVEGSKQYQVYVNGEQYIFKFGSASKKSITVPVEKGRNEITITGTADCQGIYTDVIMMGKVSIYPNPVIDTVKYEGFEIDGPGELYIYDVTGQLINKASKEVSNGRMEASMAQLPQGIYMLDFVSANKQIQVKIIKK